MKEPKILKAVRYPVAMVSHLEEAAKVAERNFSTEVLFRLRRDIARETVLRARKKGEE